MLLSVRQSPVTEFGIVLNPYGTTPLAAICEVRAISKVRVERVVIEGVGVQTPRTPDYAYDHSFAIHGLRPNQSQTVLVELRDSEGRQVYCPPVVLTTEPLPADFPVVEPRQVLPLSAGLVYGQLETSDKAYQVLFNRLGEVLWYRTREPGACVSLMVRGGLVATFDLQHGRLYLEDLTGQTLRTTQFSSRNLIQQQTRIVSEAALVAWNEEHVTEMDLHSGSERRWDLRKILGDATVTFVGSGLFPDFISLIVNSASIAELRFDSPFVEWAFGGALLWADKRSHAFLKVENEQSPRRPLGLLWAQNKGLLTVEVEEAGPVLREYQASLNEQLVKRTWTYPLGAGSPDAVYLSETFQSGHILVGISEADESRIFEVRQGPEPQPLLEFEIRGWRLTSLQKIAEL